MTNHNPKSEAEVLVDPPWWKELEAERDRLQESKDALVRKVKRLEDRVAELHQENERLRNRGEGSRGDAE